MTTADEGSSRLWRARTEWLATESRDWLRFLWRQCPLWRYWWARPAGRGAARLVLTWWEWVHVTERRDYTRAAGRVDGAMPSAPELRHADNDATRRWVRTGIAAGLAAVAVAALWVRYGPAVPILLGLVLVAVCTRVGWVPDQHPDDPLPVSPLRQGMPVRRVKATLLDVLEELKIPASLSGHMTHWGWSFTCATGAEIDDKTLRAIERACQIPVGGVTLLRDLDNAGTPELRISMEDPLASMPPLPEHDTGALSVHDPLPLGRSHGGETFTERLLRVHVSCVGRTGSGKSNGLWVMIDALSACSDVVLHGVDLSHGPMLDGWGRVIQRAAKTPADVDALLAAATELMAARGEQLARIAESDDPDDDDASETWEPSRRAPQLVIVVDELSLLVPFNGKDGKPDLIGKVEYIARAGRKYAVTLLLAGQKATAADFGSTVLRAQIQTQMVMSCDPKDVGQVWGAAHERGPGWNPEQLDAGSPKDQGKTFVRSAAHRTPEVHRFFFLDLPRVKRRRRQRLADGLPTLRQLEPAVAVEEPQEPEDRQPRGVPEVLAIVAEVLAGAEGMTTEDILRKTHHQLPGMTDARLAAALLPHGVAPTQRRWDKGDKPRRGYWTADVQQALNTTS